jgi:hypothetical protein
MTKVKALFGAGVLLASVLVATLVAPATSQVDPERVTLTFFDPRSTEHEKDIDEKPAGFSAGDWALIREKQLDPETCETAGQLILQFAFVEPTGKNDGYARFNGDLLLPDGKISIQSSGKFSEFENEGGFKFSVIGGTGAYRDATGEGSVTESTPMCEKKGDTITLDLLLQH